MVNKVLGWHFVHVHCISAMLSRPDKGSSIMHKVSSIALPLFDLKAVELSVHLVAPYLLRSFKLIE